MWIILAGTVGLASIVDWHVNQVNRVELGAPILKGNLSFQLPRNWEEIEADNPPAIATVQEPGTGRSVTIYYDDFRGELPANISLTPVQYLQLRGLVNPKKLDILAPPSPINIGSHPGVLIIAAFGHGDVPVKVLVACAVLRPGIAITVKVESPGLPTPNDPDEHLIRSITNSIHISTNPRGMPI